MSTTWGSTKLQPPITASRNTPQAFIMAQTDRLDESYPTIPYSTMYDTQEKSMHRSKTNIRYLKVKRCAERHCDFFVWRQKENRTTRVVLIRPWSPLAMSVWPNTRPPLGTGAVSTEKWNLLNSLVRILCIYSYVLLCTTADKLSNVTLSDVLAPFCIIPMLRGGSTWASVKE